MREPRINPSVLQTALPAILQSRTWLEGYQGGVGRPLDLSQAAPPYAPSDELLKQLGDAAADPAVSRYGPVPGEQALRNEYACHVSQLYNTIISPSEISITAGCNQAFMIAAMCVAGYGDEIILPVPYYFNHKMTLDMLGVRARELPCQPENGFVPDPAALESLINRNVRAVVLVSPNNPTGAIYPPATIDAFSDICREHGLWLILDETYRDFLPDDAALLPHGVFAGPGRNGTIGLYSFSKSFAIPGFRLGAMTYPSALAEHVIKVQDCLQICPTRAGQIGVTWALANLGAWRREKRQLFAAKRDALCRAGAEWRGWRIDSIGAYFAYCRHPYDMDAVDVAKRLASENGILLIPGPYFGPRQEKYLRLSFGSITSADLEGLSTRLAISRD